MSVDAVDEVNVLRISIHGVLIGYLAGFKNGCNVLSIGDTFKNNPDRPTFSLITHPKFPNADKFMAEPLARNQRLHPVFSNLLPERSLRELLKLRRWMICIKFGQKRIGAGFKKTLKLNPSDRNPYSYG